MSNVVPIRNGKAPNPVAVIVTLLLRAKERGSRYLEHQVERVAQEVLFFEEAPPAEGSVALLEDFVKRLQQRQVGRMVASYDSGSSGARRESDAKTEATCKRVSIEDRLRSAFQRPALRRFLAECGFAELASAPLACRACDSPHAVDIAAMLDAGEPLADVALWTAQQQHPVSKSTLSKHRATCLRRAAVQSVEGLEARAAELLASAKRQAREAGRLRKIVQQRRMVGLVRPDPAAQAAPQATASDTHSSDCRGATAPEGEACCHAELLRFQALIRREAAPDEISVDVRTIGEGIRRGVEAMDRIATRAMEADLERMRREREQREQAPTGGDVA